MNYRYLLFDADDTLFDFPKSSARAFSVMCENNQVPNTPQVYDIYLRINQELWAAFDQGEVDKHFLIHQRFIRFLKVLKLDRDPEKCNRDYLGALAQSVYPLPHAEEVCRQLDRDGHLLYIVTNAVAAVQHSRLKLCSFGSLFRDAFISDDAGAAKPSKAYYDYVRSRVPEISPENTLIIGDSLTTDIRGANNAGLPCCWYNPKGLTAPAGFSIDYEVRDLRELLKLV